MVNRVTLEISQDNKFFTLAIFEPEKFIHLQVGKGKIYPILRRTQNLFLELEFKFLYLQYNLKNILSIKFTYLKAPKWKLFYLKK